MKDETYVKGLIQYLLDELNGLEGKCNEIYDSEDSTLHEQLDKLENHIDLNKTLIVNCVEEYFDIIFEN